MHAQLQSNVPGEMVVYFSSCWHPSKNEWVLGLKFEGCSFVNSTVIALSVNGKLKQVIEKNNSLEEFVKHFFIIFTALRIERDHKAAVVFQKVKVHPLAA